MGGALCYVAAFTISRFFSSLVHELRVRVIQWRLMGTIHAHDDEVSWLAHLQRTDFLVTVNRARSADGGQPPFVTVTPCNLFLPP